MSWGGNSSWSGGGGGGGGGGGAQSWSGGGQAAAPAANSSWGGSGGNSGNSWGGQQAAPAAAPSWQAPAATPSWEKPAAAATPSWQGGGNQASGGGGGWNQPAAQAAPAQNSWNQQAKPAAQGGGSSWGAQKQSGPDQKITVNGCSHGTIGGIVRGNFTVNSENHKKPVYKKESQVSGLDVMIYYWDERDGVAQAGWWFGPKVGGEQVWAYNPDLTTAGPPKSGWQVPYGGPVDASFVVEATGAGGGGGGGGGGGNSWAQPAAAPQQQQWQQPAQQQAPAQQSWGQQNAQQSWGQQNAQQSWNQGPSQAEIAAKAAKAAQEAKEAQAQAARAAQQQAWQQKQQQEQQAKKAQMEEMKRRQDEQQAKMAAARTLQLAEQKRKMEEMMAMRNAAQARLKEEQAAKKLAEETRRIESQASFAIRRIIQKVRVAMPATLEAAEAELQATLEQNLDKCGSQTEKITEEAELCKTQAQTRIEAIKEKAIKDAEAKAEQELLKAKKKEEAQAFVEQLEGLVAAAEAENEVFSELAKGLGLDEEDAKLTTAEVDATFVKLTNGDDTCKAASRAALDLIKEHGATMKDPTLDTELKTACQKLLQRISDTQKNVENTMNGQKALKDKAYKKASAQEKTNKMEAVFSKYDKDKDKALNQKEVTAYAKGEFGMTLAKDDVDWVFKSLVEESDKGVKVAKLNKLASIMGVHRELARDKKRKAERIEKEKVIGGMRDALKAKIVEAEKFVEAANKAVRVAEDQVGELSQKARVMAPDAMMTKVGASSKKIEAVQATYDKAKAAMAKMEKGIEPKYEKDLKAFLSHEAKKVEMVMGRMDSRIARVKMVTRRFTDQAKFKETVELEELRAKALKVMRHNQALKDFGSISDLFESKKDNIDKKAWLAFFATAEMEIKDVKHTAEEEEKPEEEKAEDAEEKTEEEKPKKEEKEEKPGEIIELSQEELAKVFEFLEEGSGKVSTESLANMGKHFMKVLKDTAMTSQMGIAGGKALRKLDPNEVVEIMKGPLKDDSMKVSRVFCKALKDDLEGWVTVAGNAGTVFLVEGANTYKVVRKSVLTDDFETTTNDDEAAKLSPGTVVEVRQFPKKDETSGLTRMQVRVLGRPASSGVGWVTVSGKDGKALLKTL